MSNVPLDFNRMQVNGWTVLSSVYDRVEICLANNDVLEQVVRGLIGSGHRRIVIDLSRVEFMDSSAHRVLVDATKKLSAQSGGLRIVITDGGMRNTLEIIGVAQLLNIYSAVSIATLKTPSQEVSEDA